MYTIDASVWVNSFDQREAGHEISRQVLARIGSAGLPVIVPNLVLVEIAGAISRTRQNTEHAQAFVTRLRALSNVTFVVLDDMIAAEATTLAAQHALRGADAVYAAVVVRHGCTLISLDQEHLSRLPGVVSVLSPTAVLAELPAGESGEPEQEESSTSEH